MKELGLTFPVVLQQHLEISRRYTMFATSIAYLIDEAGIITHDVAVGEDAIRKLLTHGEGSSGGHITPRCVSAVPLYAPQLNRRSSRAGARGKKLSKLLASQRLMCSRRDAWHPRQSHTPGRFG